MTPQPELLTSSADEPTAEERVRTAVAGSGARGWVRRHRLLLAGSVGVLVRRGRRDHLRQHPAAAGRPGDPRVRRRLHGGWRRRTSTRRAAPDGRSTYQVTAGVGGDVNSVRRVSSGRASRPRRPPSVTCSTACRRSATSARPSTATDAGWWEAEDSDYQVSISRTDAVRAGHGRRRPARGHPDRALGHVLARRRRPHLPERVLPIAAAAQQHDGRPSRRRSQVDITLTFTNPGDHAIQVMPTSSRPRRWSLPGPWTTIPAGGQATVTVSAVSAGCEGGPRSRRT